MRRVLFPLLALALMVLLVACGGGGPRKRVFPPTLSVQELVVQPDGRWIVKLRLQNYSNVAMQFDAIDAQLHVAGIDVTKLALTPAISVPGNSVEILDTPVSPPPAAVNAVNAVLQSRAGIRYKLEGEIRSSEPQKRRDDFLTENSLTAVPGLTGVLR